MYMMQIKFWSGFSARPIINDGESESNEYDDGLMK